MKESRNFNEIFRIDVVYNNIKSRKNPALHPFFVKTHFWKNSGGSNCPPGLFSVKKILHKATELRQTEK